MEINETAVLDDRGFIQISGNEAKNFLQSIVTNDIEKISENFTLFSSIFTPQGKYLHEFFILKIENGYLLECEKIAVLEILKIFNFYKLRSKVDLINVSQKYTTTIISIEKFKTISKEKNSKSFTIKYDDSIIFVDPRNKDLGARVILKATNNNNIIKKLSLKKIDKKNYYKESFDLGIPQVNLNNLKDKIFGIENNLDELSGIDFKKGCYIGQENTSRIKLRNKLRRRVLPIKEVDGKVFVDDIIKYKDKEIGKIVIDKPFIFAIVKIIDPELKEFANEELVCGNSKIKILKPKWI